ncbi:MAG TPA: F0F1 ATP synthase subunit delta [Hellea balneolensis]|uniref:ATP synthase subunit delta n=1 Tax=Hellea balneolensis TaxID=287478 RepID=A0A7C5R1F2_9PROT|nr:F0F1 ATP synthase subunit delta [Hellea balneolensis]
MCRYTCTYRVVLLVETAHLSLARLTSEFGLACLWIVCMSNAEIIMSEAAQRYASALLDLATESKSLKTIEKDVKALRGLFTKSADLMRMVKSPVISDEDKKKALLALAKKAKLSKLSTQFIGTCVQNHRAGDMPQILADFEKMLAKRRGTETADLISAKKLTAAQVNAIKAQLKKTLGKDVALKTHIDPELLGGFIVKVGSRYFDSSLKSKLERMTLAMKEA